MELVTNIRWRNVESGAKPSRNGAYVVLERVDQSFQVTCRDWNGERWFSQDCGYDLTEFVVAFALPQDITTENKPVDKVEKRRYIR